MLETILLLESADDWQISVFWQQRSSLETKKCEVAEHLVLCSVMPHAIVLGSVVLMNLPFLQVWVLQVGVGQRLTVSPEWFLVARVSFLSVSFKGVVLPCSYDEGRADGSGAIVQQAFFWTQIWAQSFVHQGASQFLSGFCCVLEPCSSVLARKTESKIHIKNLQYHHHFANDPSQMPERSAHFPKYDFSKYIQAYQKYLRSLSNNFLPYQKCESAFEKT